MNFEKRNIDKRKRLPTKRSILTVIEISKKINELLEQTEYNNSDMLLTKEHIKYNLSQLIKHSNFQGKIKSKMREKNVGSKPNAHFSQNYYIDNRGRLITTFIR